MTFQNWNKNEFLMKIHKRIMMYLMRVTLILIERQTGSSRLTRVNRILNKFVLPISNREGRFFNSNWFEAVDSCTCSIF